MPPSLAEEGLDRIGGGLAHARKDVRVEVTTLCFASKPYDKHDADGQQGACEPERDECLPPVRAVAHRLDDPDADAPRVERANERGDASEAERAESRRPGDGAPKRAATSRFRAHGSMMQVAARPVNVRSPATSPPAPPAAADPPRSPAAFRRAPVKGSGPPRSRSGELGERSSLRVPPVLADPVGAFEVGEHQNVEQLGAGSGTEGVQALTERMLHLLKGHDTDVKYDWADCRPSGRHRTRNGLALGHGPGASPVSIPDWSVASRACPKERLLASRTRGCVEPTVPWDQRRGDRQRLTPARPC